MSALGWGLAVSGAVALLLLGAGWALAAYAKHLDAEVDRSDVDPHEEPADSGLAAEVEGFLRDQSERTPPIVHGRREHARRRRAGRASAGVRLLPDAASATACRRGGRAGAARRAGAWPRPEGLCRYFGGEGGSNT